MKRIAFAVLAPLSVLALSACGKSDDPNAVASADNAEMPAEEALNSAEAGATPEAVDGATEAAAPIAKTPDEVKAAAAKTAQDFEDLEKEDAPKQ